MKSNKRKGSIHFKDFHPKFSNQQFIQNSSLSQQSVKKSHNNATQGRSTAAVLQRKCDWEKDSSVNSTPCADTCHNGGKWQWVRKKKLIGKITWQKDQYSVQQCQMQASTGNATCRSLGCTQSSWSVSAAAKRTVQCLAVSCPSARQETRNPVHRDGSTEMVVVMVSDSSSGASSV